MQSGSARNFVLRAAYGRATAHLLAKESFATRGWCLSKTANECETSRIEEQKNTTTIKSCLPPNDCQRSINLVPGSPQRHRPQQRRKAANPRKRVPGIFFVWEESAIPWLRPSAAGWKYANRCWDSLSHQGDCSNETISRFATTLCETYPPATALLIETYL